jgi:biopolymer transport protein ExbD
MIFKKTEEEDYGLQLTPLIDVVFLLLIFFMVSTAFIDFTRRMDIQLPESKAADVAEKIKNFVIEMPEDKKIYLNGKETSEARLEKELIESSKDAKRVSVIIKADKRLPYGNVIKVMGIVKNAKIRDIGVAVK